MVSLRLSIWAGTKKERKKRYNTHRARGKNSIKRRPLHMVLMALYKLRHRNTTQEGGFSQIMQIVNWQLLWLNMYDRVAPTNPHWSLMTFMRVITHGEVNIFPKPFILNAVVIYLRQRKLFCQETCLKLHTDMIKYYFFLARYCWKCGHVSGEQ